MVEALLNSLQNKGKTNESKLNPYLKKREAKLALKRIEVINMHSGGALKPKQISRLLRMPIKQVYQAIEKFRYEVKTKIIEKRLP